uniref:DUF5641 domain-containing protein n=1 Tax=Anopheles dirus TaxID=7168 RepID=A0A182NQA2_9DIPT
MVASAFGHRWHHSSWRQAQQCIPSIRLQTSTDSSRGASISSITHEALPPIIASCRSTTDAKFQSTTILDNRWQEFSSEDLPPMFHLFSCATCFSKHPDGRPSPRQSYRISALFCKRNRLLRTSVREGHASTSGSNKGICSNIRVLLNSRLIIKEDNIPSTRWPLARIVESHPGKDGVVRVVTLRTAKGVQITRPIVKLCVLSMVD